MNWQSPYFIGIVIVVLLGLVIALRRRQPKDILAYKTENGNVTISRSAIVELVRTSCEKISQVRKPKLQVFTKKGLTHFNIRIHLTGGGRLKDIEEMLQHHLRESLSEDLGIENLGTVNIIVAGFKSSKIRPNNVDSISASQTPQEEPSD